LAGGAANGPPPLLLGTAVFKKKSYPVHRSDVEAFAQYPVVIAVLIDAGFMTDWPHEWTRDGNRSRRRHQEPRGYNANYVFSDACQRLWYLPGHPNVVTKPSASASTRPLMRGEVQDAEAIDAED
jgi:hypothetical protein